METFEIFDILLQNLKVGDASTTIAARRDGITKALNKNFRSIDSSTGNRLMVGSYGRYTAIRGVSDLDMIFILPSALRASYTDENGPRRLLKRVRDVLNDRYPSTDIRVDQCVVRVQFVTGKFKFEVQPAFENEDGSFAFPDTVGGWKITKPRAEITATKTRNHRTSNNMRHLARMVRAWKNANGVAMGGLLVDTLVHRFFSSTTEYDGRGTAWFDWMVRDFFEFLMNEPEQEYYLALGSNQRVMVKKPFQAKARKAYNCCLEAIDEAGEASANQKWRQVFGTSVPLATVESARSFDNTEEFIEDRFPVDITDSVTIDCEVTQNGWRPASLREMLRRKSLLRANKALKFEVVECSVSSPYDLKWKVLNRGPEAERRNMIRGQIVGSSHSNTRLEHSEFQGGHVVECYVIKDGVVVARGRIDVPISNTSEARAEATSGRER